MNSMEKRFGNGEGRGDVLERKKKKERKKTNLQNISLFNRPFVEKLENDQEIK